GQAAGGGIRGMRPTDGGNRRREAWANERQAGECLADRSPGSETVSGQCPQHVVGRRVEAEASDSACRVDVAAVAAFECEGVVLAIDAGHEANMRAGCARWHTSN